MRFKPESRISAHDFQADCFIFISCSSQCLLFTLLAQLIMAQDHSAFCLVAKTEAKAKAIKIGQMLNRKKLINKGVVIETTVRVAFRGKPQPFFIHRLFH
ncbi:hypothetical protein GZ78_03145 [Endozoicomonas numazuensis]|uniref:Uncharacterized protein n=1 Tax=Endozoicomonas numazuensis TaxID=1137799 RepID=A0A081NKR7_9GAMM|nr:hypothetical protein GZ78_03145 [Endozoicomonas numazuensis]